MFPQNKQQLTLKSPKLFLKCRPISILRYAEPSFPPFFKKIDRDSLRMLELSGCACALVARGSVGPFAVEEQQQEEEKVVCLM